MNDSFRALDVAATLTAFVDVLIPGDEDFPAASHAGTHGLVFNRIRQQIGNQAFPELVAALSRYGDFVAFSVEAQRAVVTSFQTDEPELFKFLRFATYFSYYETPPVIAALQALGHDYNDAPQPQGYELPPFDPATHLPTNPRGAYKKTDEVTRIDLSELTDFHLPVRGA